MRVRSDGTLLTATLLAFLFVGMSSPAVMAQQFNWKFASYVPPTNKSLGVGQKWWAEQVEKRSNGQIKVKIFWADELCGTKDMAQAVKSGLADVVVHAPVYTPGE